MGIKKEMVVLKKFFHFGLTDYISFSSSLNNQEMYLKFHFLLKMRKEINKLKFFLLKDSLTGLFNRYMLKFKLNQFIASRDRKKILNISFAMIDIDFFKKINDQYGHIVGDFILKELSKILKTSLRVEDYIFRYGGEEFFIIINNSFTNTFDIVERLRLIVEKHVFKIKTEINKNKKELHLKITISIGLSLYIDNLMTNKENIIELADLALFYAKNYGRNQTVCIPDHLFII